MRVVGYAREALDPRSGEPAFAQSERIRRWAADGGHVLVAICQDLRSAAASGRHDGLRAVMGIIAGGAASAVVVPDLATLSPDAIVQEIVIRDLRARGASVISVDEADHSHLEDTADDRLRLIVRDVLVRLEEHRARFEDIPARGAADEAAPDVVVELVPAELPEPAERIRPVR